MAQFDNSDFQRAFAAVSFVVGRRDSELLAPFAFPHQEARAFARGLAHPERERRAEALARELARVASALEARSCK